MTEGAKKLEITISMRDILYFCFRRKRVILSTFFTIVFIVICGVYIMTPQYYVYSTIFLERGQQVKRSLSPEYAVFAKQELKEAINSEVEIIKSRAVLEKVVDSFPDIDEILNRDPSTLRRTIQDILKWPYRQLLKFKDEFTYLLRIRKRPTPDEIALKEYEMKIEKLAGKKGIKIEPVKDSDIIHISVRAANPEEAKQAIDALVNSYFAHRLDILNPRGPFAFFNDQIEVSRQQLNNMQASLSQFQEKEGLISYEKQESFLLSRINTVSNSLINVKKDIISKESKLKEFRVFLSRGYEQSIPSIEIRRMPIIQKLYHQLVNLRLQRINLLEDLFEDNPKIRNIEKKIERTKIELENEVRNVIILMENSLKALKSEEAALKSVLTTLVDKARALPRKEKIITGLVDEINNEKMTLARIIQKRDEERISSASDPRIINIKVVSNASFIVSPIFPGKKLYIGIGVLIGLISAFGMAYVFEYFDHSIKTESDIENYLGLTHLVSIPIIKK